MAALLGRAIPQEGTPLPARAPTAATPSSANTASRRRFAKPALLAVGVLSVLLLAGYAAFAHWSAGRAAHAQRAQAIV